MNAKRITATALAAAFAFSSLLTLTGCGEDKPIRLRVYNWEEYIDEGGEGSYQYDIEENEDAQSLIYDFEIWYEETYDTPITVEYSTYFDLTLSGYQLFRLPLPLGGTSNHFRTELHRQVGPWDPFNVTEDCDLGLRIYEKGYRTTLFNSTTYEEANCELWNWMRQRSRWVKGFIQTHLVHYRNPFRTVGKLGWYGALGGFLAVGGSALMMLTNIVFWGLIVLYIGLLIHGFTHGVGFWEQIQGPHLDGEAYRGIAVGTFHLRAWPLIFTGPGEDPFLSAFSQLFFAGSAILFLANFLFIGIGIAACVKRRMFDLIPAALLMPLYWLLISLAAWKGFWQIFTKPFYWEKTKHGLTDNDTDVDHTTGGTITCDKQTISL